MLRTAIAIGLVGGVALAAPEPPRPTWADWVGDYEGPLAWRGCTAGAARARVTVEAVDGALSVDLAGARGGLGKMSLVEEDAGLAAQQGDVTVVLARPRADAVELRVELASGCTVTGRLVRASSGVAACDRLAAWARVDGKCTKPRETLEALPSAWKPADAARCVARADRLERTLIDAGCAPHPDPLVGVRAADCLQLRQATERLARCRVVPPELMQRLSALANGLAAAAQTAEPATLPTVEQQCRDARTEIVALGTRFHCTP